MTITKKGGKRSKYISGVKFAKMIGVNKAQVYRYLKDGKMTRRKDGLIDPEKAKKELAANIDLTHHRVKINIGNVGTVARQEKLEVADNFKKARAFRERYRAKIAEIEYKNMAGLYVLKTDVEKSAFNYGRKIRDKLLNVPDRIYQVVAAETDPAEINKMLKKEIELALEGSTS